MSDIDSILEYYANLLIVQYHDQPKAVATINLIVEALLDDGVFFDVRDGFNLDTAVGVQLDTLGKYIGVDRFFSGSDFGDSVFGFADAENPGGVSAEIEGFEDAAAPGKVGIFVDAEEIISTGLVLSDDSYRILLKFKILQNSIDHSDSAIDEALFETFGDDISAVDNYNMTMTYFIAETVDSSLLAAIIQKDVLLRPMAVGIESLLVKKNYFAFVDAENTDAIGSHQKGFNDATTGLIKDGGFLNAETDISYV